MIDKKNSRIKIISFCLICLIHFILYADFFINFQKENQHFINDPFLITSINKKKLSGLIYDYKFRGSPIYIHFLSYFIVWEKGIATTNLIDYRFGLIRRKADTREFPVYNEWVGLNKKYNGEYDQMDYILIRGTIPDSDIKYFDNFILVKSLQKWSLYERITEI